MDLIGRHLHQEFISFEHIDGNTEIRRWQETLERLEREHTFSVLIMTTGVGGFGYAHAWPFHSNGTHADLNAD